MNINRREFLSGAATTVAVSSLVPQAFAGDEKNDASKGGALSQHSLPPLAYAYNALEPHLDAQTMELHHTKHHKAYVDGLNKAEAELAKLRASGDYAMIEYWSKKAAFHGGGHYLHSMFWKIMAPPSQGGGGEPTGVLADKIREDFGSFDNFKKQFTAAAIAVEGSGWALVHFRPADKRLIILQAENQHKLSPWGSTPIMGIDVWEHAYYLKYQNKRADYVNAWWNVVNWKQVTENMQGMMR